MASADYREHIFKLAEQTLKQLRKHDLAPTPSNYTLWLTANQGYKKNLSVDLRQLQRNKKKLEQSDLEALYEKYFIDKKDGKGAHLQSVQTSLVSMQTILNQASANADDYHGRLDQASTELASGEAERIEQLVAGLIEDTVEMRNRTASMQSELIERKLEIEQLQNELVIARRASELDELTGIGNRRQFEINLAEFSERARDDGQALTVLMIDVDHFKKFNDTHGHQIGDIVLRLIAGLLTQQIKGQDSACRYGGEEFAILLPETDLAGALSLAERIRSNIASQRPRIKSKNLVLDPITLSIGVAQWSNKDTSASFIERADQALYLAKKHGRNVVCSESDLKAECQPERV